MDHAFIFDSIFYDVRGHPILQGVFLRAERASICSIFGRNGSGKTTLLKIGAGQLSPISGSVCIDGERYSELALQKRFRHLAFLPQESMLPAGMRVKGLLQVLPKSVRRIEADDVVRPFLEKRIKNLSTGQRRYLELQIVLNLDRNYVLLDEPFSGLEPILVQRMLASIVECARRGAGILIADHHHADLISITDCGYMMKSRQCRKLSREEDLEEQLRDTGYLPKNTVGPLLGA
jgi:lipopolysaccharide export system ATP-binding protein